MPPKATTASLPTSPPEPEALPAASPADTGEVLVFPTTVGQKRFWSLDAFHPGNPALNMPLAARLEGRVVRSALQQSLDEVLRRHEVLRSRFEKDGDELVQVLCPATPVEILWLDCTATAPDAIAAKTQEVMLEEGHRSFNLAKGPFLRAALATFSEREHVLMLTMHHAVSDGWSNGILIREFAENYTRILRGEQPPFGDLELQYADYAVWQRDWLQSPEGLAQKQFWSEQLGEVIPVLNLPTDAPRGRKVSTNGTIASRLLPIDLSEAFKQACQQENATPFMGYLAAYVALLRRYSAREEFVVGSPAACRNQTELEPMIGLFANPMLIRLRVTPEMTFRQLLQHVRDTTLASVARQEYPFEIIAENLRGEDSRRGVAWLQAYFVYQKAFMQPQHMPDLELTPLRSISAGAVFEWFLGPVERKEGVRLQLEYNTDLFTAATIERAMAQVHTFVAQAARNLDFSIGDLDLDPVSPSLAPEPASTVDTTALATETCIDQVSRAYAGNLSAVLLTSLGEKLGLREFEKHSFSIRSLITEAAGKESVLRIGVPTEHAGFALISALSVLDAGHVAVLLASGQSPAKERVDALLGGTFFAPTINRTGSAALPPATRPGLVLRNDLLPASDLLASPIPFSTLLRQAASLAAPIGLRADDRVLSLAPLDTVSGWEEVLAGFQVGATVIRDQPRDAAVGSASVIFMSSGRTEEMLLADVVGVKTLLAKARLLVVDRDPISPAALKLLRKLVKPDVVVLQRIQPQEVGATVAIQTVDTSSNGDKSPAGPLCSRIAGWNLDLVDARGVRVPHGLPGRLRLSHFSWPGLATALLTSDYLRCRHDGSLETLGRAQDLRLVPGYQLELKQLRDIICQHAAVWNACVVVIPASDQAPAAVVAHVIPLPGTCLSATDLKTFLGEKLPAYMLPAHLVVQEKIPLTAAGRVDYVALGEPKWLKSVAAPTAANPAAAEPGDPTPRGEVETKLAALFAELLRVREVDVRQSFFDLGGHSLLGVKLFAEIEKQFNQRLPLATLLASPSVRALAKRIESSASGPVRWPCLVPVQTAGTGPRFFCVHGAGGNVLLYRDLARRMAPDVRFFGLQAQGLDGHSPCLTSVEDMAALYLQEILAEQPGGPYYIGGYCMGGNIAYEIGQLLLRQGHTVGFVAMLDSYNLRESLYTGSPLDRFRILLQKGSFHLDTLVHLTMSQRRAYLAEKMRMAVEMVQGKGRALRRGRQQNGQSGDPGAHLVAFVQNANHLALKAHHPKPFAGDLVLFRPRKNYHTFPDPQMGWGDLVKGRLDAVELPANPHAMLLEPFVRYLADRMKERMFNSAAARR